MSTYTKNYNFEKIDFDFAPWDDKEHNNWDLLDSILSATILVPGVKGVWMNSTAYKVNDTVLDPSGNMTWYTCVVAHTSAATGTFTDDRTANPSYWTLIVSNEGAVRYDIAQTLTPGQKAVANNNAASVGRLGGTENAIAGNFYVNGLLSATSAMAGIGGYGIDSTAVWRLNIGNPILAVDNNDYLQYNRAIDTWQFFIGGATPLQINGAGASTTGTITASSVVSTALSIDSTFYMLKQTPTAPAIIFDSNDFLIYDRPSDKCDLNIGGSTRLSISAANGVVIDGRRATGAGIASSNAGTVNITTAETTLVDVTVTATGNNFLITTGSRVYNVNAGGVDVSYFLRIYDRTAGDALVAVYTRPVTATASTGAVQSTICLAHNPTIGRSYLIRLAAACGSSIGVISTLESRIDLIMA